MVLKQKNIKIIIQFSMIIILLLSIFSLNNNFVKAESAGTNLINSKGIMQIESSSSLPGLLVIPKW
ncbi:hypothetical protein [Rummeliibacillus pycnus]|uniref:hypothetical protein n=1 Tax=Rummeliibacillus pycnus TaxID=101070 RepID=UPI0014748EF2|nr:hypothetical protein [Rummeliibacillus pycnus]